MQLLKKINFIGMTERPKGKLSGSSKKRVISENIEIVKKLICSLKTDKSALHAHKTQYEIEREAAISLLCIAKRDFLQKNCKNFFRGYCHSPNSATIFSHVDLKEVRLNVSNEITLICAKIGADLINIQAERQMAPYFGLLGIGYVYLFLFSVYLAIEKIR